MDVSWSDTFQLLIPLSYSLLCRLVDQAQCADSLNARTLLFRWLRDVSLLCTEARNLVRQQPGIDALLFYELHRVRPNPSTANSGRQIFDFTPPLLPLFEGPHGSTEYVDAFSHQTARTAIEDRFATVRKLEQASPERVDAMKAKHNASDLHSSLPAKVRVFVGRARYFVQGIHYKAPSAFTHCDNMTCRKRILTWDGFVMRGVKSGRTNMYWEACGGSDTPSGLVDDMNILVCGPVCELKVLNAIQCAACFFYHEMNHVFADAAPTEAKRMVREYNEAMSRNAIVSRRRRAHRQDVYREQRRGVEQVLHEEVREEIYARVTKMLNVDLALTYAARTLANDNRLMRRRAIPSAFPCWREHPSLWKAPLEAILLYMSNSRYFSKRRKRTCDDLQDEIVSCKMNVPEWMQKVRDKSGTLFPVNLHRR